MHHALKKALSNRKEKGVDVSIILGGHEEGQDEQDDKNSDLAPTFEEEEKEEGESGNDTPIMGEEADESIHGQDPGIGDSVKKVLPSSHIAHGMKVGAHPLMPHGAHPGTLAHKVMMKFGKGK